MLVSELVTAASAFGNQSAAVKVAAPSNPLLNAFLAQMTVNNTGTNPGGDFVINLNALAVTFRVSAPYDTALSDKLSTTNILGVDLVTNPGVAFFTVDT
jgi:hypothetical protein